MLQLKRRGFLLFLLVMVVLGGTIRADNGFSLGGSSGVRQQGRGGAWIALADDPTAVFLNPAGLVGQPRSFHNGGDLMFMRRCYTRLNENGQTAGVGGGLPVPGTPGGPPLETCNKSQPFLNPQLAAVFHPSDRWGYGFALHGPHGVGKIEFPETVSDNRGVQPSPGRYTLDSVTSNLAFATFSAGYAVNDKLSLGAGFMWGIFTEKGSLFGEAYSPTPAPGQVLQDDFFARGETKATLDVQDLFVPGFVLGGLWSPTERLSFAGSFQWHQALRFSGDVRLESRYWAADGSRNLTPCGANEPANCNITDAPGDDLQGVFNVPSEVKVGMRYHRPRAGVPASRDVLVSELWDIEVDFTYARNSVVKTIDFDLRGSAALPGSPIPFAGAPGATISTGMHLDKHWKDVVGVRVGGDRVIVPGRFAVRAGGFYESKGGRDEYLNLHFYEAARGALATGATIRWKRYDLSLAYQHTFFGSLDNGGRGDVLGLSGDAANDHSTWQAINGGRATSSLKEIGLSVTARF